MGQLKSLVESLPKVGTPRREKLDVSSLFGQEEGKIVFEYEEMTTGNLYSLKQKIIAIQSQRPDWPEDRLLDVATLATCHRVPADDNVWLLYAELSERLGGNQWLALCQQYRELFPAVHNFRQAVESEKNALTPLA